jgi:hypothetical protein
MYTKTDMGSVTKLYFPTAIHRLNNFHIRIDFITTQFFTGHGKFNSYLNRFKLITSSNCECGYEIQTPMHLILDCPRFSYYRYQFENNLRLINQNFTNDLSIYYMFPDLIFSIYLIYT